MGIYKKGISPLLERKGGTDQILSSQNRSHIQATLLQTSLIFSYLPRPGWQAAIHKPTIPLCPIISTRGSPNCYDTAKHLTSIHQPLVGQSQHNINNSNHFVDILSKTTIDDTDMMVSFDVESLFTNVPVTESCRIVKERLETDDTLPDRTPLTPDEIHDLMYFCLNSTSFKWRDNYYQQLQGAAMG